MSAKVPPALAKGDEPNVPAINREMISMAGWLDSHNREIYLDSLQEHKESGKR